MGEHPLLLLHSHNGRRRSAAAFMEMTDAHVSTEISPSNLAPCALNDPNSAPTEADAAVWLRKHLGASSKCTQAVASGLLSDTLGSGTENGGSMGTTFTGNTGVATGTQARVDMKSLNEACGDFGHEVAGLFLKVEG